MRAMMGRALLREHPMMIPKNRDNSATALLYIVAQILVRRVVAGPTSAFQPRRLTIATVADGCKRLLGGESERRIQGVTKAARAVLADALRLDLDARAELASELLASLDGPADPDAEAAWAAEIQRRVAAIEAGTMKLEPWKD